MNSHSHEIQPLGDWFRLKLRILRSGWGCFFVLFIAIGFPFCGQGAWDVLPIGGTAVIFGSRTGALSVAFKNNATMAAEVAISTRLLQTAGNLAVSSGVPNHWKSLSAGPTQTLLESVPITPPSVRVPARFLVEFSDPKARVLGRIPIDVVPTNQLAVLPSPVALLGDMTRFRSLLEGMGVRLADDSGPVRLMLASGGLHELDRKTLMDAATAGAIAVEIVGGNGPVVLQRRGAGVLVKMQAQVAALEADASTQHDLVRCVEAAIALNAEPQKTHVP